MLRNCFLSLLLALVIVLGFCAPVRAAEVDCDTVYCFTSADFAPDETLAGVCITGLPDAAAGTVLLGSRIVQPGDILTAEQLAQMTFQPLRTETDQAASVTYLPIYDGRVEPPATMTIAIRGKQDQAPVAEDFAMETYKNLPNTGNLKVTDPEGQPLTYTVTRQPKRGEVIINADGSFTYTPKKNKVGVDSFAYTATDPAGNVSREATVTIQILKPTDATQYTDTIGRDCRFAAEWMRNTGLFVGEQVGGTACFYPDKTVTRGEFLTMLTKTLDIPVDKAASTSMDAPDWLQPYLAAAVRSGLIEGVPMDEETGSFNADTPITGAEAAVMLQNALDLDVSEEAMAEDGEEIPAWAAASLAAMAESGINLTAEAPLTRSDAAIALYQTSLLALTAPGTTVLQIASAQ